MSKRLFDEFDSVSAKQWKQKIQFDLKGDDYNDTLIWKTKEGIDVKPFYHSDTFNSNTISPKTDATSWGICQSIYVTNIKDSREIVIKAINGGVDSIKFVIPSISISLERLLKDIDFSSTTLFFQLEFQSTSYVTDILNWVKTRDQSPKKVFIFNDIISNLVKTGNWYKNLNEDHTKFTSILEETHICSVDASIYQNAGANIVQQLAYSLAHVNEYLNVIESSALKFPKSEIEILFNVAVGTNYFFEIAKLRALRLLWETLSEAYQIPKTCHIIATPSIRNKTIYDYNNNMLRTTTECMSAILGSANTVCNLPYDAIYHKNNAFGTRIARNQLLVLKHESYFDKVKNPSDGAYYIESLTEQLTEKALKLFKDIEANGGFLNQLKSGIIQRKIKESAIKEQEDFNSGKYILLGTNKHPNKNDRMKHELELNPFLKKKPRKTLIVPIIEKRLAEQFEQERLKTE